MEPTPEQMRQQRADIDFEEHGPGRGSKLEAHRVAIAKMRRRNWPYRRIVEWLGTERGVSADPETVRSFCRVRKIRKGIGETASAKSRPAPTIPSSRDAKARQPTPSEDPEDDPLDFDLSKPLRTWKDDV